MMRLTLTRLRAIENALNAILAGAEGEGDAGDIPFSVYDAALCWAQAQIAKRIEDQVPL